MEVVQTAYRVHETNVTQIETLYGYYKGDMSIYDRVKEIRPEIDYKIVENRCKEVVDFKAGYSLSAPIQYNDKTGENQDKVNELNTIMDYEGRNDIDEHTVEWNLICGTSYKIALPKEEPDEISPLDIGSLDPRQTFVIYSSGMWHKPLAGVWFVVDNENNTHYYVYTPNNYFKLLNFDSIEERTVNGWGMIPIVEFPANNARLGCFEGILDLQDAINVLDSDRLDGVSQFVQSLVVTWNCNFEESTTASTLAQAGLVNLTSRDGLVQDLKILAQEMNQTQTQTLKNDLYDAILTICALPNRESSSDGDTGIAVVYRDGWSAAETAANKYEAVYKRSEKKFLEVCLAIMANTGGPELSAKDVEVSFPRKNYEGISSKVNILNTMLNNPKIAPRLAFIYSNVFPDPEEAYRESLPYIEANDSSLADTSREAQTQEVRED